MTGLDRGDSLAAQGPWIRTPSSAPKTGRDPKSQLPLSFCSLCAMPRGQRAEHWAGARQAHEKPPSPPHPTRQLEAPRSWARDPHRCPWGGCSGCLQHPQKLGPMAIPP